MGKPAPYLFQKRGIYYLQKRVPQQLVPRLGRVIIRKSLRTTCRATAIKTAGPILKALDREMRLSEAAGLAKEDVVLDADIPHVIIRPHPWRRLKTKGSERTLPLVGPSLWAANRAVEASQHSPYLFPRYCNNEGCNSNSASAALNKWLKQTIGDGYVMHSFRHSMRDRLRAVSCPSEMIDQIGGWSSAKVGEGYGEGFRLTQVFGALLSLRLEAKPKFHN